MFLLLFSLCKSQMCDSMNPALTDNVNIHKVTGGCVTEGLHGHS